MSKPSIGRIVNYVLPAGGAGGMHTGEIRPLIITSVFTEERVNGQVFLDGRNDVGHDDHAYTASHDETDHKPGTWHWPARV